MNLRLSDPAFLAVAAGGETDPYFGNVSLLLHGDGANGSTTIVDSSSSPKTVTAVGNAQISTAQSKFGGSSIAFDGTGDYLTINSSNELILGATWTIEFFTYLNTFGSGTERNFFIGTGSWSTDGHLQIYTEQGPTLVARGGSNISLDIATSNSPFAVQTWTHVAVVCNNLAATIFINGVANGSGNLASSTTSPISTIGRLTFADYDLNGYINELRITKGVARYTSNFTPPTAPFPDF